MFAYAMRVDSANAVCGDQRLIKKLPSNFRAIFAATEDNAAKSLADELLGPFISPRGHFSFEQDQPSQWLQKADLSYEAFSNETEQALWAARSLGSIQLTGIALYYSGTEFYGFWLRTTEGGLSRVLASEKVDGSFEAMPRGFEFRSTWLARLLTAQH